MTLIELQRNRTVDVIWIHRLQRASPVPPPPRARSPLAGRVRNPAAPKITRGLFPSRAPSANSGCARVPPTEPAPRRRPQGCARRPPAEPALHRCPVLRAPAASAGTRGPRAPRLPRTRPALQPHPAGSDRRRRDPRRGVRALAIAAGTCAGCGLGLRRHLFGIFGSIFGDFSFFTLEAKSREICFRKLLLGHL